ncbi:MAG: tyrosine-type recombinase/integrase [Candidatus Bathyarchaeota archaeon]|nr:tyrosine-type recombinase/integrase [Candidatus Bathyarchaeota archaeon]
MAEGEGKGCSSSIAPTGENAFSEEWRKSRTHCPPKEPQPLNCPKCGSTRIDKNGHRYLRGEIDIQRFVCQKCGYRFSEPYHYKGCLPKGKRRICAVLQDAKNLTEATKTKIVAGRENHSTTPQDVKGKIVELCFHMQKQGYSETTIRLTRSALNVLSDRGADLSNPESVKETIFKQHWSEARKRNVINAYTLYLKIQKLTWEPPRTKVNRKFPFIPTEKEIDDLIAGCGKKCSTFLQLLKETAMRCGEAKRLEWTDIDFEKNIITLNLPEKGSNPRLWKVSQKLISMLNNLPRDSEAVFGSGPITSMKTTFGKARKRLAEKLQNPRLKRISFHTLRHWKATMLQHQTKDPLYVRDFLGHKELRNTEIYITIERTLFEPYSDEFTVRIAEKPEDVKSLLEVGFEYVCQKDNLIFLRKRK